MANVVEAIETMHDEMVEVRDEIVGVHGALRSMRTDLNKLLDHFGLVSGGTPIVVI